MTSSKKEQPLRDTRRAVELTRKAGIGIVAHCVLGFPGETEEEILATISFVKSLDIDFAQFYCAVPFPGSALYEEAKKKGWINTNDWSRYEQNYSVIDTPSLKAKRVMELRTRAFKEFYLQPRAFLRVLKYIKGPRVALNIMRMVRDFYGWI